MIRRKEQRELLGIDPRQHKTYQQLLADKRLIAPAPQRPCDVGLFSDEHKQTDLLDMLSHDKKA